jgi:hypothetical protein
MAREIEKQLMKELERAIEKRDDLTEKASDAQRVWFDANAKAKGAQGEVRGLLNAVASIRSKGEIITDTHRRNVEREVYDAKKEKPVA